MSQEDTYRPAVLPSEAVMMPATEEAVDAPLPVAQDDIPLNDPAMMPAQRPQMSIKLEKMRKEGRLPQDTRWISTSVCPLDQGGAHQVASQQPAQAQVQDAAAVRPTGTISQGSALSTLMRSATRQYMPAPSLAPRQVPVNMHMPAMSQTATAQQPQMRGALRQVVRNAQQPQAAPAAAVRPAVPRSE